jgi:hypothetical protein
MSEYFLVDDSAHRTPAIRQQGEANYYGRVLVRREDKPPIPAICGHGGSMWLCPECAFAILGGRNGLARVYRD